MLQERQLLYHAPAQYQREARAPDRQKACEYDDDVFVDGVSFARRTVQHGVHRFEHNSPPDEKTLDAQVFQVAEVVQREPRYYGALELVVAQNFDVQQTVESFLESC